MADILIHHSPNNFLDGCRIRIQEQSQGQEEGQKEGRKHLAEEKLVEQDAPMSLLEG